MAVEGCLDRIAEAEKKATDIGTRWRAIDNDRSWKARTGVSLWYDGPRMASRTGQPKPLACRHSSKAIGLILYGEPNGKMVRVEVFRVRHRIVVKHAKLLKIVLEQLIATRLLKAQKPVERDEFGALGTVVKSLPYNRRPTLLKVIHFI